MNAVSEIDKRRTFAGMTFPSLNVTIEKGEQTWWISDEILDLWDRKLTELEDDEAVCAHGLALDGDYWRALTVVPESQLPASVVSKDVAAFIKVLRDDVRCVMRMVLAFEDESRIADGIFSYADYHERIFTISWRDADDHPYWPLVRLAAYARIGWFHTGLRHSDVDLSLAPAADEKVRTTYVRFTVDPEALVASDDKSSA
jgi:hypothetical protein